MARPEKHQMPHSRIAKKRESGYPPSMEEDMQRIIFELGLALSGTSDLIEALNHVLDAAFNIEAIDCGGIYLVGEGTGELNFVVRKGLTEDLTDTVRHFHPETPEGRQVRAGKPFYGNFSQAAATGNTTCRKEGLSALAVVPIKYKETVVAALHLASRSRDQIPVKSRRLLELIAAHLGPTMARIMAESSLRKHQSDLEALFNSLEDFIFICDLEGWLLHTNLIFQKRLGYKDNQLSRFRVTDLLAKDDGIKDAVVPADLIAGRRYICYAPMLAKDGRLIPVETKVIKGKWSGRDAIIGISRDLTNRKQAEMEIKKAHSDLKQILNASVPLLIIGNDFTMLQVNETYCSYFKVKREEVLGRKCHELWKGPLCHSAGCALNQILSGKEHYEYEWEEAYPNGQKNFFAVTAVPYRNTDGEIIGIIENFTNITDLKKAQEALQKAREELEQRVKERTAEIEKAMAEINIYRKLLPICSHCKKIRDDGGEWHQMESYIREHSDVEFSHGVCPECLKKLYADYIDVDE